MLSSLDLLQVERQAFGLGARTAAGRYARRAERAGSSAPKGSVSSNESTPGASKAIDRIRVDFNAAHTASPQSSMPAIQGGFDT
jgi:hypothetical protein